jgi:tRNA C32,U32 (ribose-2'-O)-methylase TrmJ
MTNEGGNIATAIKAHDGKVILMYHTPVREVVFDSQNALNLAHALARCSYEARYGKPPADEGNQLLAQQVRKKVTKEVREMLIKRVKLSLRSLSEQHRSPEYIATQLVDTVLSGSV